MWRSVGMKELENELYRHYAAWDQESVVQGIQLDVEGKGIDIALGWREGAEAPCPECGKLVRSSIMLWSANGGT